MSEQYDNQNKPRSKFRKSLQELLELREEPKDKPGDLKRCEEKLEKATFECNRAVSYTRTIRMQ